MEKHPELGYYSVYDNLVKRADFELTKVSDYLARILQKGDQFLSKKPKYFYKIVNTMIKDYINQSDKQIFFIDDYPFCKNVIVDKDILAQTDLVLNFDVD